MIKIYFSKFEINPKVLDENEYPIFKDLFIHNPDYKYYKLPKVKDVFFYYIYLYSLLIVYYIIELINHYFNTGIINDLIHKYSNIWESFNSILIILSFFSLVSFVPTLFNYLEAYFECKQMNKILKNNVTNSLSYNDYLSRPRY